MKRPSTATAVLEPPTGSLALVGHHNVGKSVIFQRLTGRRVTVANYPGTTVEISRGHAAGMHLDTVIDTPGVTTLPAQTEDEIATSRVLLEEPLGALLQVGDAKNLRRTLLLTVQLAELGVPMTLALNMADEADERGVRLDPQAISQHLGIPVVRTIAIRGEGLQALTQALEHPAISTLRLRYPEPVENALSACAASMPASRISPRGLALLWLSGDPEAERWLRLHGLNGSWERMDAQRMQLEAELGAPPGAVIQQTRLDFVEVLAESALQDPGNRTVGLAASLAHLAVHPLWGIFVLLAVLGLIYWFVGLFGAGTLVELLEAKLFGEWINPWISGLVAQIAGWRWLQGLLVGRYGLWTMGVTYAIALILPIVATFFLAFGVLEDSGYLPRLAVMANRAFSRMGLNGKAVLPMVLGLGCVTMATLTTRVLESRRDRILATLLLALAIPCSAQLGVVLGMLASVSLGATLIWAAVVLGILLLVGSIAAKLLPGQRTPLLLELPPLRWPVFSNLISKTLARIEWYLKEVVPMFLLGTAALFVLDQLGVLPRLILAGEPLVSGWLGLPPEASSALLMGFLRRDFGATGLFVMQSAGQLTPIQVVVAMVTITLFIPCIASVLMIARERGWRLAAGSVGLIFPLSFLVGGLLYRLLSLLGWSG